VARDPVVVAHRRSHARHLPGRPSRPLHLRLDAVVTPHMRDYMAGRITAAEYVQRVKDDVNAGRGIYGVAVRPRRRSWFRRLLRGGAK